MGGVQRVYNCIGVDVPKRIEWSPIWFREINLTGSMAVGTEQLEGERPHTYEVYLRLVRDGRLRIEQLVPHTFALHRYADAFTACAGRGGEGRVCGRGLTPVERTPSTTHDGGSHGRRTRTLAAALLARGRWDSRGSRAWCVAAVAAVRRGGRSR